MDPRTPRSLLRKAASVLPAVTREQSNTTKRDEKTEMTSKSAAAPPDPRGDTTPRSLLRWVAQSQPQVKRTAPPPAAESDPSPKLESPPPRYSSVVPLQAVTTDTVAELGMTMSDSVVQQLFAAPSDTSSVRSRESTVNNDSSIESIKVAPNVLSSSTSTVATPTHESSLNDQTDISRTILESTSPLAVQQSFVATPIVVNRQMETSRISTVSSDTISAATPSSSVATATTSTPLPTPSRRSPIPTPVSMPTPLPTPTQTPVPATTSVTAADMSVLSPIRSFPTPQQIESEISPVRHTRATTPVTPATPVAPVTPEASVATPTTPVTVPVVTPKRPTSTTKTPLSHRTPRPLTPTSPVVAAPPQIPTATVPPPTPINTTTTTPGTTASVFPPPRRRTRNLEDQPIVAVLPAEAPKARDGTLMQWLILRQEESESAKPNKPKRKGVASGSGDNAVVVGGAKKKQKSDVPRLPKSAVKELFGSFLASHTLSSAAIDAVIQGSQQYFANVCDDLMAFAQHAGRDTIQDSDLECIMRRQGCLSRTITLADMTRRSLGSEEIEQVIPIATPLRQLLADSLTQEQNQ
eukprot:c9042_g1_i3.p1 GENE.c9042_g1_i3~~c9042_g1_i3.p1  ORF type:complete len:581 (+),score=143.66 c9042_g1_i3:30-1772(+)